MAVKSLPVVLLALFVHAACQRPAVADGPGAGEAPSLVQWLQTQPDASDFLAILEFSGLAGLVEEQPEITVVVPTNAGLKEGFPLADDLLKDRQLARFFIRTHCLPGPPVKTEVLGRIESFEARTLMQKRRVWLAASEGLHFDSATIVNGDHRLANGVAHLVDLPLRDVEPAGAMRIARLFPEGKYGIIESLLPDPPERTIVLKVRRGSVIFEAEYIDDAGNRVSVFDAPGKLVTPEESVTMTARFAKLHMTGGPDGAVVLFELVRVP